MFQLWHFSRRSFCYARQEASCEEEGPIPPETGSEVQATEIEEYISLDSDFAFEIGVLNTLTTLGLSCRHSGSYEDPVTGKLREFDIHAVGRNRIGRTDTTIRFAIECKNLGAPFPLIVHCMPRTQEESYVDCVWSAPDSRIIGGFPKKYASRVRLQNLDSPYPAGQMVGKSIEQFKRKNVNVPPKDRDYYDRLSQSLSSAYHLLRQSHFEAADDTLIVSAVIPILVVPDGRLWSVEYETTGAVRQGPVQCGRISYFADHSWSVPGIAGELATSYRLSHVEICERSEVENVVLSYLTDRNLNFLSISEAHERRLEFP